jgi:hypothetical protein
VASSIWVERLRGETTIPRENSGRRYEGESSMMGRDSSQNDAMDDAIVNI